MARVPFGHVVPGAFIKRTPNDASDIDFALRLSDSDMRVEATRAGHSVGGLALFARLEGPRRQHFGCHLDTFADGLYGCEDTARLEAGTWKVSVFVERIQGGPPERCLPPGTSRDSENPIPMLDYILGTNFSTFAEFRGCFAYVYARPISLALWTKKRSVSSVDKPWTRKCGPSEPGLWMRRSERGAIRGPTRPDPTMFDEQQGPSWIPRHVFAPFHCRYRLFTAEQARSCMNRERFHFIGDSRTRQLWRHAMNWTGLHTLPGKVVADRLGLATLVSDEAFVLAPLLQGRTVILSSLLHDMAEFAGYNTIGQIRRAWDAGYCGMCSEDTEVPECECVASNKTYAPQRYLANLEKLAAMLRRTKPRGKLVWLSYDNQPPAKDMHLHTWQSHDILMPLLQRAKQVLAPYATVVDLGPMMASSPNGWWIGPHFRSEGRNMFVNMAVQILLNGVCGG